jgi:antibiotic biosynthesis monooxygenase (ABM) superfamily enzyme
MQNDRDLSSHEAGDIEINYGSSTSKKSASEKSITVPVLYNAIFQTTVPENKKDYFEKTWLPHIYELLLSWNGFHHRSVHLLKIKNGVAEYVVILSFRSYESFRNWNISSLRKSCIEELSACGITSNRIDIYGGDGDNKSSGALQSKMSRIRLHDSLAFIPRPYPPAKWKLTIIIFVGVCIGNLLLSYSGFELLLITHQLPTGFRIFVALCITVPILSYCFFPMVMRFKPVAMWLRNPRGNVQDMSPIQALLVQGLLMFASNMTPVLPRDLAANIDQIEGKLMGLRRTNFVLSTEVKMLRHRLNLLERERGRSRAGSGSISPAPSLDEGYSEWGDAKELLEELDGGGEGASGSGHVQEDVVGSKILKRYGDHDPDHLATDSSDGGGLAASYGHDKPSSHGMPLTMAVTNWVKWECVPEFEVWSKRMAKEMSRCPPHPAVHCPLHMCLH